MRPNIVFFGEAAPKYELMYNILEQCDILVVIGTSGNVIDVNYLSSFANYSILNNLEANYLIYEENFNKIYYEDANNAYAKIEEDLEELIDMRNDD